MELFNYSEEIPTDIFCRTPHIIRSNQIFFPISIFPSLRRIQLRPSSLSLSRDSSPAQALSLSHDSSPAQALSLSGDSSPTHARLSLATPLRLTLSLSRLIMVNDPASTASWSWWYGEPVSGFQPHSGFRFVPQLTYPSPFPASAHLAPAAAPAPAPPGPPGVMSVAELVRQPGRDHLPYLTPFKRSGNGISAWINRMMYSALDKGHPTFTDFPAEKQHMWFRQFAMAAQQAGYEAQKRLNQQKMEMMQRMYPNEVFPNVDDE
uniref:Uncharacterized protein n=1 Tax=Brassica oleracea var. oleracea TaxID=109376 RepID=A0A0D3AAM9_BRAOL